MVQRMMVQRGLVLFVTMSVGLVQGQDTVKLDQDIQGTTMTTRNGREIFAYLGIPYAEPPVGPLRFKNPVAKKSESGTLQADSYGNKCPQLDASGAVIGDEDCLVLNVFTPKIDKDNPYPVMVYFHGGNFVCGSAEDAGPDYLLDKDIVLVTVNYRLGALGFLSTYDEVAPGNAGLWDQTLALKWVRKNILQFGGRKDKVTIFGHDAGASSTMILAVSDSSKDLFDQFISQSGSPISFPFFIDEFHGHYSEYAKKLGKSAKCPTNDSSALVECLRSADVSTLVDTGDLFGDIYGWRSVNWAPTTEPLGVPGTFLTNAPRELALFKEDWIKDCPAIVGIVHDEGLFYTAELYVNDTLYNSIKKYIRNFLVPVVDAVVGDDHPNQTAKKVYDFYFDDVDLSDKNAVISTLTNVMTDSVYMFPNVLGAWMMQDLKSSYFTYEFNYRGSYSQTSEVLGNNDDKGITHGDDFQYLFPQKNVTTDLNDFDGRMIDIMTDFWTSFATNGVPTSESIAHPDIWKPYLPDEQSLQIGKDSDPSAMSFISILEDSRFLAWNQWSLGELFESLASGFR